MWGAVRHDRSGAVPFVIPFARDAMPYEWNEGTEIGRKKIKNENRSWSD